ncbi:MAG: bifunctional nuclease family protein [SAR202 cluster bacterium]|nr:bifunctional nuclease family protein [SAR202 cluster bacterium]
MMEMVIDSIRVSLMNYHRVVILRARGANRYLPIWIGPNEADAIAVKLQDVSVPRPLTHDLLGSVISSLGATVQQIVVSDLSNDTFFAKIVLQVNGSTLEVDSRPSDAIALAVRQGYYVLDPEGSRHVFEAMGEAQGYVEQLKKTHGEFDAEIRPVAPIFADDSVLDKAGVEMDEETGKPVVPGTDKNEARPLRDEELKSLSAFSDFIENLDLDDLGGGKSKRMSSD